MKKLILLCNVGSPGPRGAPGPQGVCPDCYYAAAANNYQSYQTQGQKGPVPTRWYQQHII